MRRRAGSKSEEFYYLTSIKYIEIL